MTTIHANLERPHPLNPDGPVEPYQGLELVAAWPRPYVSRTDERTPTQYAFDALRHLSAAYALTESILGTPTEDEPWPYRSTSDDRSKEVAEHVRKGIDALRALPWEWLTADNAYWLMETIEKYHTWRDSDEEWNTNWGDGPERGRGNCLWQLRTRIDSVIGIIFGLAWRGRMNLKPATPEELAEWRAQRES